VTQITEVQRMESDVVTLQPLYEYKVEAINQETGKVVGSLEPTALRPTLLAKFARRGIDVPADLFTPSAETASFNGADVGNPWTATGDRR
jgi:pilus assembly protein CpaF